MDADDHHRRVREYYRQSKRGYNLLLWGSKHFGFYPKEGRVSEKQAQLLMQDLIGDQLHLSQSMRVLDAGCGQGVVATYLTKKFGCAVDGITIVPFEVEAARDLAQKQSVSDKVKFHLMDYSSMTFTNDSFDAIYTIESLSHTIDIGKTLSEFYRVLKTGGRIALFEYTIADDKLFTSDEIEILNNVIADTAMDGLKQFRHDAFGSVIEEAGFVNVRVQDISWNVEPSLRRLRRYALIPYLLLKLCGAERGHPNRTAAVEFHKMGKKGLLRYNIFTADK